MENKSNIAHRPIYCPNCGYDLRAATSAVCSECGSAVGRGIASRIPWVQRRWRGRFWGYWGTVWMVLRQPAIFAEEVRWRVSKRDARGFFWVTMVLATIFGTGMAAVAFGFHASEWEQLARNLYDQIERRAIFNQWLGPEFVLWDNWLGLVPAGLAIFLSLWVTQGAFRGFLMLMTGQGRNRMDRIGRYFSVVIIFEAFFIGILTVLGMIGLESPVWSKGWIGWIEVAALLVAAAGVIVFCLPTISLIMGTTKERSRWLGSYIGLGIWWLIALVLVAGFPSKDSPLFFNYEELRKTVELAVWILVSVTTIPFIGSTLARKRRGAWIKAGYMLTVYPVLALAMTLGVTIVVFWVCGFIVIAAGSMLS